MATKAQQNDDGTVSDPVTTETQKGYANYEKAQADAQKKRESKNKMESLLGAGMSLLSRPMKEPEKKAKGGVIKDPTMTYQTYSKTGKPAGMKTITVKKASGGSISSASKRADGCAIRGKTRA